MKRTIIYPSESGREKIYSRLQSENLNSDLSMLKIVSRTLVFSSQVNQTLEKHFQRYDLSQPGFLTLMMLYSEPDKGWTAIELARDLQVKAPTMTGILDTLEKSGYLVRVASSEDRRKNYIHLSSHGKAKLKKILPDHVARLKIAFSKLTKQFLKEQENVFSEIEKSLQRLSQET